MADKVQGGPSPSQDWSHQQQDPSGPSRVSGPAEHRPSALLAGLAGTTPTLSRGQSRSPSHASAQQSAAALFRNLVPQRWRRDSSTDSKTLDLSHASAAAVDPTMEPDVAQELHRAFATLGRIEVLRLPPGLTSIPEWVLALPSLTRLEVTDFAASELTVDHPGVREVHLLGDFETLSRTMPAGLLVNIPATAEVYCRRPRGDGPERAVRVVYREPESGETQDGVGVGQLFYAASPPARSEIVNGYRRIHLGPIRWDRPEQLQPLEYAPSLTVQFIRDLQAHRTDGATTSFAHGWGSRHANFHKVEASMELDKAFVELQVSAPRTSLVGHSQWGAFMREQFDAMESGAYQHFVLSAHREIAVAVELAVLDTPRGKRYVVSLFDPEFPLTHSRIVEDDLEQIEQWTAASFMPSSLYRSETADEIALFSVVPPDFHTRPLTEPLPEETLGARVFEDKFLNAQQSDSPFAVFQMTLAGHLTEDALRERLARCPTDSAKRELLAAKNPRGLAGLSAAALRGDAVAVRTFGRVMYEAWTEGYLLDSEFLDLLSGNGHPSPLHLALMTGEVNTIAAIDDMLWDTAILNGLERGLLHSELERIANLAVGGGTTPSASALAAVMSSSRADAVDAYRKILGRARAGSLITPNETYEALDLFSYPDGILNLGAEQIKAFDDMLADPQLAPDLTGAQVMHLLASLLDAVATRERRAKMDVPDHLIQEFSAAVNRAHARGQLSEEQLSELRRAIVGGAVE